MNFQIENDFTISVHNFFTLELTVEPLQEASEIHKLFQTNLLKL